MSSLEYIHKELIHLAKKQENISLEVSEKILSIQEIIFIQSQQFHEGLPKIQFDKIEQLKSNFEEIGRHSEHIIARHRMFF